MTWLFFVNSVVPLPRRRAVAMMSVGGAAFGGAPGAARQENEHAHVVAEVEGVVAGVAGLVAGLAGIRV
jgi:hypothetical protein